MASKQPSQTQVPPPGTPTLALLREITLFFLSNWGLPGDTQPGQQELAETQASPPHGLEVTGLGHLALCFGA